GVATVAWAARSARQFTIRHETLAILPAGQQPIRILHIGDMHLVSGDTQKIQFVRNLTALRPDVVINIGDNPGEINAINDLCTALEPLLHVPGVFFAGSNDFHGPKPVNPLKYLRAPSSLDDSDHLRETIDAGTMFQTFTAPGMWQPIAQRNLNMTLSGGVTLQFAGTHDAHMGPVQWPGFSATTSTTTIKTGVTHAPYRHVLDAAIADGADLVLAGHTHGGQVTLPEYGAIVTNCDLPTGLAAGLFPWRSAGKQGLINVTAG